MTTYEKLHGMLVENGMFESQATEVMKLAIPELEEIVDGYDITLNQPANEYPKIVYTLLFIAIKPIALKWIEDNVPMAWFKPMFQ